MFFYLSLLHQEELEKLKSNIKNVKEGGGEENEEEVGCIRTYIYIQYRTSTNGHTRTQVENVMVTSCKV